MRDQAPKGAREGEDFMSTRATARRASIIPFAAVIAVTAFLVAGCGGGGDDTSAANTSSTAKGSTAKESSGGLVPRSDIRIAFANVGISGDPFYNVIKNGAEQAGKDLGIHVDYKETQKPDPQEQARLIETVVAQKPDALIVTDNYPDILDSHIKKAVDAGIPTLIINALGPDSIKDTGALGFIGQQEFDVGKTAGQTMRGAGIQRVICVMHSQGSVSLTDRCNGLKAAYGGGKTKNIAVDGTDQTAARNGIEAAIKSNPDYDGMLTLGPPGAEAALKAIKSSGSGIKLATIDLTPDVLKDVAAGNLLFASDQQQFLQGYLPVQQLAFLVEYGIQPPGFTPTGPHYVTKDNAEAAIKLTEQGVR
jgi:simple sugar transport system substrate-binding protein